MGWPNSFSDLVTDIHAQAHALGLSPWILNMKPFLPIGYYAACVRPWGSFGWAQAQ